MKWMGDTNTDDKIIRINKRLHHKLVKRHEAKKAELLDTIVHEEMHAKHPKMKEKTVHRKTPKVLKKLTMAQKKKLYAKFR